MISFTNQDMTQESVHGFVVKGMNFVFFEQIPNIENDLIALLVLNHTGIDRNDTVSRGLVYAGDDLLVLKPECRLNFMTVMKRVIHPDDFLDVTIMAQQTDQVALFYMQLIFIGFILQLTSAAFFGIRTRTGCLRQNGHGFLPVQYLLCTTSKAQR